MDSVNAMDFYKETYTIKSIKFFIEGKSYALDLDYLKEGSFTTEEFDNKEMMSFTIEKRNGIDNLITKCEYCIYKPYEVVVAFKSNFGSTITTRMYTGKFDFKDLVDYVELYFYGSLTEDADYKTEEIEYLIEEA